MTERQFKKRTRSFALRVIQLVEALPERRTASVLGRQLLRSGTSVGANYRAACRGRSRADMKAKLAIVEEELDESLYWIRLLVDAGIITEHRVDALLDEGEALLSMVVSSIRTLRD
jgi:four helix bundle protein